MSLINSTVRHRKSEEFPRSLCQIKYRLENKGSEPRLNDIGVRLLGLVKPDKFSSEPRLNDIGVRLFEFILQLWWGSEPS